MVLRKNTMKKHWITLCTLMLVAGMSIFPAQANNSAYIRILNAVSMQDKVDVYVDGYKKYNDINFAQLSKYEAFPAGYHTVRVATNEPARTIVSTAKTFKRGMFYTVTMYGTPARRRLMTANDTLPDPSYGKARLTAYHLSPGMKPFDVVAYLPGGRIQKLISNVRYGQAKAANIPATPMTIRLVRNNRIFKTVTGVSPRSGLKYAAYAVGRPSRNFKLLVDKTARQ